MQRTHAILSARQKIDILTSRNMEVLWRMVALDLKSLLQMTVKLDQFVYTDMKTPGCPIRCAQYSSSGSRVLLEPINRIKATALMFAVFLRI